MNDTIRCSSLDKLFACTPAVIAPDSGTVRVETVTPAAELGKVVHTCAASMAGGERADVKGECNRAGIDDTEDASKLFAYACQVWNDPRVKQLFGRPGLRIEYPAKAPIEAPNGKQYTLSGTLDVAVAVSETEATFLDWKSGFADEGYHQQMYGYAYLLWVKLGRKPDAVITGVVAFLRHRYLRVIRYTAARLEQWARDLSYNVLGNPETYHPGQHCVNCAAYHGCMARKLATQSTMLALMPPAEPSAPSEHTQALVKATSILANITPENKNEPEVAEAVAVLRFALKLARKWADDGEAVIRDAIDRVGDLPVGADHKLVQRETEHRHLDPAKAIAIARRYLSEAEIADAMRLSLPKLLAAKAGKHLRGEKRAARELFEKELEAAGAVTLTTQRRLEEVEARKELPDETGRGKAAEQPERR
jgi:hypothetical protein